MEPVNETEVLAVALRATESSPVWSGNTTDWQEVAEAVLAAMPGYTIVERRELERLRRERDALADDEQSAFEDLESTRGALITVAQWDSWASEWLAKHAALTPSGDAAVKGNEG